MLAISDHYRALIYKCHEAGASASETASRIYHKSEPIFLISASRNVADCITLLGDIMQISCEQIEIVGSARLGFSLRNNLEFSAHRSDIDLAIISRKIYDEASLDPYSFISIIGRNGNALMPIPNTKNRIAADLIFAEQRISDALSGQCRRCSIAVYRSAQDLLQVTSDAIIRYHEIKKILSSTSLGGTLHAMSAPQRLLEASASNFTAFPRGVQSATPENSGAVVIDINEALDLLLSFGGRDNLVANARAFLSDLDNYVFWQAALIGGSVIQRSVPAPRDIDIVVFYVQNPKFPMESVGKALHHSIRVARGAGIDARLVPVDVGIVSFLKMATYFSLLYSQSKAEGKLGGFLIAVNGACEAG